MATTTNWEFTSISIDFDVYKALTADLESPTDTYNDVLRRKFGLKPRPSSSTSQSANSNTKGNWVCDGVNFPEGTEFHVLYKGRHILATVQDGGLIYDGQKYFTPSAAAIAVTGTNVNGWRFWECRFPGQKQWSKIDRLRS